MHPLPIRGQGVFIFSAIGAVCKFWFNSDDEMHKLFVEFTPDHVSVTQTVADTVTALVDPANKSGLSPHRGAYYWFSIDSQNQRLLAGVGEARLETAIYTYSLPPMSKKFLESLVVVTAGENVVLESIRLLKDPVTDKVPLKVKDINTLTMEDIAANAYIPKANLSLTGQKLYDCIAGKQFTLDTPDFPDFTQAIEYSIRTPGCWCNTRLQEKSREFNPDKPDLLETYLRITLGKNNGESPGIPYVMEIWPVGHYSPIHSHANADAIIRVLNGEISVSLYPFLCAEKRGDLQPFGTATFTKDEITWISPTLNQTHQLKNLPTNSYTCITIQCYMYPEDNKRHYDYFDYIDADGKKQLYEPDSDMDFIAFKQRMREEWVAATKPKRKLFGSKWRSS
jgi:hypothetical protein